MAKPRGYGHAHGAVDLDLPLGIGPLLRPGQFFTTGVTGSTSAALNASTLRLAPFWFAQDCLIDQIGVDFTVAGSTGALFRPAVYDDDGTGYPGALLLDAGTLAVDGTITTPPMATVSLFVTAGLKWLGGVLQGTLTTQPTVRIVNAPGALIGASSAATTAGILTVGYAATGVTGAPPNPFTASLNGIAAVPRVIFHVAGIGA